MRLFIPTKMNSISQVTLLCLMLCAMGASVPTGSNKDRITPYLNGSGIIRSGTIRIHSSDPASSNPAKAETETAATPAPAAAGNSTETETPKANSRESKVIHVVQLAMAAMGLTLILAYIFYINNHLRRLQKRTPVMRYAIPRSKNKPILVI